MRGSEKTNSMLMALVKGALLGVLLSLLLILLMSVALEQGWMELKSMQTFTLIFKLLSALAAGLLSVSLYKAKALLTGACAGLSYAALAYICFSIISGRFFLSWGVLGDLGLGALCGAVAALLIHTLR